MNYLICSAGRRCQLLDDLRHSMEEGSCIVATDSSPYAPALYFADRQYIVEPIYSPEYIETILKICKEEKINAVLTCLDPEIMLLAENREMFTAIGVELLTPYAKTARLCFDKYEMYSYLTQRGIRTPRTWGSFHEVCNALEEGEISFPVFVKPRTGSGSVGARRIDNYSTLQIAFEQDKSLIAQEWMNCLDLDVDVYVDTITHEPVSIFAKRKISTTIGGANKTISFKDEKLFRFVKEIVKNFEFHGPIDADLFYKDGEYYLSEINPRFGGAYLHAYGAGVDFFKLLEANLKGNANQEQIGDYEEDIIMMMYDNVIIKRKEELAE